MGRDGCLSGSDMCQLQLAGDITDGVDVGDIGATVLIDGDEAVFGGDVEFFQAELGGIGPSAGANQGQELVIAESSARVVATPGSLVFIFCTAMLHAALRRKKKQGQYAPAVFSPPEPNGPEKGSLLGDRSVSQGKQYFGVLGFSFDDVDNVCDLTWCEAEFFAYSIVIGRCGIAAVAVALFVTYVVCQVYELDEWLILYFWACERVVMPANYGGDLRWQFPLIAEPGADFVMSDAEESALFFYDGDIGGLGTLYGLVEFFVGVAFKKDFAGVVDDAG